MGLKERYEEERQRREARAYFRQHNSEFFSFEKWITIIIGTIVVGVLLGSGIGLFTHYLGIYFSALYIVGAYLIMQVCTSIAGTTNTKLMIVSMISYTIMIIFTQLFALYGIQYLMYFSFSDFMSYFISTFTGFRTSFISILFILMGYGYIYQNLK